MSRRISIGGFALGMALTAAPLRSALANGEAEYEAPIDRPVSSAPDRPLPYPVAEEGAPRGTAAIVSEDWPSDFAFLTTPHFSRTAKQSNAAGEARHCFEAVVLRGTKLDRGQVTIPAGGLSYIAEGWPAALPFRQDAVCVAGVPETLIDFEQT